MSRAGVAAVLAATLVVLAGCSAGPTGGATPSDARIDDGGDDAIAGSSGSVNFYVSDRPGAMDDFEHLNVTVTTVRFHLVERADSDVAASGTNGTATATRTATGTNATTVTNPTDPAVENETETEAGDAEKDAGGESESEQDGDGRWIVRDIDATTVDLTTLRGDNATQLDRFDLPAGEYDKVVLGVSDVNATLTDGESTRVKLPSGKLQLETRFEIGDDAEVDFVYDVMVHEAGKSGKYILRPVLSESGIDQPIEPVDRRGRPIDDVDDREDRDETNGSLSATLTSRVVAGENVTLRVTDANGTVANATVTVDGERVGITGSDGTLSIAVPDDREELEIEVETGDRETEIERKLGGDGSDSHSDNAPGNGNGDDNTDDHDDHDDNTDDHDDQGN